MAQFPAAFVLVYLGPHPSSLTPACTFPMDTPAVLPALLFGSGNTKNVVWGVKGGGGAPIRLLKYNIEVISTYFEIVGKAYISRYFKLCKNYSIPQHNDLSDEDVTKCSFSLLFRQSHFCSNIM